MKHYENFAGTIIASVGTWAVTASDIMLAGKVATVCVGTVSAIFFGIKTFYDMKRSRHEYKATKETNQDG